MKIKANATYNLRKKSMIFGIMIALLSGIVSTIIIGINLKFIVTLIAGTLLGLLNTLLLDFFTKRALDKGKTVTVLFSCYLRLIFFVILFYFSITLLGNAGGLGAGIGYLSSYAGIMLSAALMPKDNPVCEYEEVKYVNGKPRILLIKKYETVRTYNGRNFVTHKIFKKVKTMKHA